MLQQIPRAFTGVPPSLVMLPPQLADVEVTAETSMVVKTGATAKVANVDWLL